MAHGLRVRSDVRAAVQKYRRRSATVWGIPDGTEPFTSQTQTALQHHDDSENDHFDEGEEQAATEAQQNIDAIRQQAAADDLLHRQNHRVLEYHRATERALKVK